MTNRLIDLHTHILPGLDDGAYSLEDSFEMARLAVQSGVYTVVATPHSPEGREMNGAASVVEAAVRELQYRLRCEDIPLRVLAGMEVMTDERSPSLLADGELLTINGTRYVLAEFPFEEDPDFIGHMIRQYQQMNFVPVVAHPERYYCVQEMPQVAEEWRQDGGLMQINKSSVLGQFGEEVLAATEWLLQNGAADILASDAHSPFQRTTDMSEAVQAVARMTSAKTVSELLIRTPWQIIHDELLLDEPEGEEKL